MEGMARADGRHDDHPRRGWRRTRLAFFTAILAAGLAPAHAKAQTKDRVIDHWSGVVLNCGPGGTARWAVSLCQTLVGEMRTRAVSAKVPFVAVPVFTDDVTLDRRGGDEGLDFTRLLHARLEIAPTGAGGKGWSLTILLRAISPGPIGTIRRDGPYNVLVYTPMVLVSEPVRVTEMASLLADHFFTVMLKKRP